MASLTPEPTGRLAEVLDQLGDEERDSVVAHLTGGSSASWLARTLSKHGHPIGATTIKDYRAVLRETGGGA